MKRAAEQLSRAGVPDPDLDSELLLRHVLGWDRATLVASFSAPLSSEADVRFIAFVDQRARRRPLQHLVGHQEFWRRTFRVTPDVLIPRPETEGVVDAALASLHHVQAPLVVDVGTGSGCIALSIAADLPGARVHGSEISPAALEIALENARRLGVEERVTFHLGDLLEPLRSLAGSVDLVVSNPPYVDPEAAGSLAPEVQDHEPAQALFPPGDAYAVYRRLIPQAADILGPRGALVLEIGLGMEPQVAALARQAGLHVEPAIPDLQGIPRVLVAHRK